MLLSMVVLIHLRQLVVLDEFQVLVVVLRNSLQNMEKEVLCFRDD